MLQQTCEEIRTHLYWAEARRAQPTLRELLRESDILMQWMEDMRLRDIRSVPYWLWQRLMRLMGRVDAERTPRLQTVRDVERLSEELFEVQELMMGRNVEARRTGGQNVVPLFGS